MHTLTGLPVSDLKAIHRGGGRVFPGEVKKGKEGKAARRIQEWLCLHGEIVAVDGEFGDGTEDAVMAFQSAKGLAATGIVDEARMRRWSRR